MGHLLTKYGINASGGAVIVTGTKAYIYTYGNSGNGAYSYSLTLSDIPTGAVVTNCSLTVAVRGDMSSTTEYVNTQVNGISLGNLRTGYDDATYRTKYSSSNFSSMVGKTYPLNIPLYFNPSSAVNYVPSGMSTWWNARVTFTITYQYEQ